MKKILMVVFALGLICGPSYGDAPSVQVQLTTDKPEIFVGDYISVNIKTTNIGKNDVQLINSQYAGFHKQWVVDNPKVVLSGGGIQIISVGQSNHGEQILKPGQSYDDKANLYIPENIPGPQHAGISENGSLPEPVTFRLGFRAAPDSEPNWSDPITIKYKKNENFPVKIEVSLEKDTMDITDVQRPMPIVADIKITNIGDTPQDIGMAGVCCLHELTDLKSDNDAIVIDSGITSCLSSLCGSGPVTLKLGEVWEQKARIMYGGEDPKPAPITFRVGAKNIGHLVVWGNSLTINVTGGTDQWTKHVVYLKNLRDLQKNPPKDGTVKLNYEDGTLMSEITYKDGKLNGPLKRYYANGNLQSEGNYKEGKLDGPQKTYGMNGQLSSQQDYKYGELTPESQAQQDAAIHKLMIKSGCANCAKPGEFQNKPSGFQRVKCNKIGVNWVDNRIVPASQLPDVPDGVFVEPNPVFDSSDLLTRLPSLEKLQTGISENKSIVHYGMGEALVFGPVLGPDNTGFGITAACSASGITLTPIIRQIHHLDERNKMTQQPGNWRPLMVVTFAELKSKGTLSVRWTRQYDDGAPGDESNAPNPSWNTEKLISYEKLSK